MARTFVLLLSVVAVAGLAFLTLTVALEDGVTPLVVLSFVILALLGLGVLGALTSVDDE
jgi:hypothetical protein